VKDIGLHIRLINSIVEVAQKAKRLNLSTFQTFLINSSKNFTHINKEEESSFLKLRPLFKELFLHGSYWINCASSYQKADALLERELIIAEKLQFDYLVIHPGAISRHQKRTDGLLRIAQRINHACTNTNHVTILLENVAHAKRSLGGNFEELKYIIDHIEQKNRIGICLDTAHAHVFGYNLQEPETFLHELEKIIPLKKIKLIHLNDTQKECGSNLDVHSTPGKGKVGKNVLQSFIMHPQLKQAKIILELPSLEEEKEVTIINDLKNW
jgi:deoxyribonuclease IV